MKALMVNCLAVLALMIVPMVALPLVAAQSATNQAKQELIRRFRDNAKTDHKAAYTAAKAYARRFPNDESDDAKYMRRWMAAYGKVELNGQPATKNFRSQQGIEMVYIPPGRFLMGSEKGGGSETPLHEVTISYSFYMGKYEVTQAQWQAVMGNNPSNFKGDNLPVEQVSWDDAIAFIARLNAQNDGYSYRLPTEAEWEYASRAGTSGEYAGDLDAMAWYGKQLGAGAVGCR
jgi:formylglycine-generating enzyme required for sulfatase activity